MPLSVTLGKQNLVYGDGFLICDGYPATRAAWTNPITSFYAMKAVYELEPIKLEGFVAMADQDKLSYETYLKDSTTRTGKRNLYGANLHYEKENSGTWDLGIFYKDDASDLQSDTLAISQRGSYTFDLWSESDTLPQLTLEGEIVDERVIMTEIGLSPTKTTLIRGQYYYFTLDRLITSNAGREWSHEFNICFDYFPNDWFFCGAHFGYARPLQAAKAHKGDDEDTTEIRLWVGVAF